MRQKVLFLALVMFLVAGVYAAISGGAHYRYDNGAALNDLRYTPGAYNIRDASQLCPHANTKARRHVTASEKKAVCAEYNIPASQCNGRYLEIDHLIPLELGGANSIQNLWPEFYLPKPGARQKDVLENRLHSSVCSGKMSLSAAQRLISYDWYQQYAGQR